jgi:hypothetical protein
MTVSEMIEKLRLVEETGKGNLEVLFQDAKEGFGWGIEGKYTIGHCDDEGYVWHPMDITDARELEGKEIDDEPDVIMFY